ncbi:hypothetical protein LTR10_020276 [Elasticomyces elasticus]|uniref:Uncharacterized protein n=1 Tax=Exophiala sideris TaxID=1016849 RepID=A0ABR0IV22_9EURO|nr:hypothetical protein LTR10_020276 [Elasticomyces elasticus]KAK5021296.1 hypothetical protein LTS07_011135 [Exophiala sideris]KAK5024233.1 hypothetical protein LTR13_010942 [Exophiala sideris]KAK5049175.1 hypothetical protein LTR69_011139 [Exophiala sideris]KAK5176486.1 hypothetical protein LTR44_010964 [Eurotiomycetes sp. CCFEE 6388]
MPHQVVAIENVSIKSQFWSQLQDRSGQVTIPAIIKAQKSENHWQCLTWKEGHHIKPHPFWDSDIYKVTEAACYYLIKHPEDHAVRDEVEGVVDMIRSAQHEDGYINSYYTVRGIEQRWTNLRDMHELYCLGHLLEATVAYETLNNSGKLLDIAMKALRHVDSVFGLEPTKKQGYPGHEEIEIGLLRLYELTRDPLPLKLARYFIFQRGQHNDRNEIYFDDEARARGADPYQHMGSEHKPWYEEPRDYAYQQADHPITELREVKGHSVRAMYYFTAATDLARLLDQDAEASKIKHSLDLLWRDLVDRKMYVTGGIGSVRQWEGFGESYALPDLESQGCYAETCATFALINWCQRLLRLNLKSEYGDVMETCLYNAFLGAVNTDGDAFYYQNVLRTVTGRPKERSKWFGVACCPPNVAKLLGSLGPLIYSMSPDKSQVAIHLYIGSEFTVPGTDIVINQETSLPWSGNVTITVKGKSAVGLALRIPTWASGAGQFQCSAEGEIRDGYLQIPPTASADLKLTFSVAPRIIYANPLTGKDEMCLARGPLIYCIEDVDNQGIDIDTIALVDTEVQEGAETSIAGVNGVVRLVAKGRQLVPWESQGLYGAQPWQYEEKASDVVAVPYFLRANRGGNGAMRVWTKRLAMVGHRF